MTKFVFQSVLHSLKEIKLQTCQPKTIELSHASSLYDKYTFSDHPMCKDKIVKDVTLERENKKCPTKVAVLLLYLCIVSAMLLFRSDKKKMSQKLT